MKGPAPNKAPCRHAGRPSRARHAACWSLAGVLCVTVALTGCDSSQSPAQDFWPDGSVPSDASETGQDPGADGPMGDVPHDVPDNDADADLAPDTPPGDTPAVDDTDTPQAPDGTTDADGPRDADVAEDPHADPDAGPAPTGCVTEIRSGHSQFTCGAQIQFDIEVPAQCLDAPCGVVVDVHGLSMDADQQDRNTQTRALGAEFDYIVVQPSAPNRAWSGGQHDEAVWAFLLDVVTAYVADRDRLHFMGFSQGGDFTLRMLCAHADELASVSPAATNGLDCQELPAAQIPILQLHGTEDVLYRYDLAERLRDRMVEHWVYSAAEQIVDEPGYRAWRRRTTTGTEYLFYAHDFRAESFLLGGHCFPGSPDAEVALPNQLFPYACVGDGQFDYGRLAVEFFRSHPRVR